MSDFDDDWDDEPREGGKRDMTLVYAVVAAAIVIVLAVVLTRPKDDNTNNASGGTAAPGQTTGPIQKSWQGPVGEAAGDAASRATGEPGIYIWTDFGGWHVRNNGSGDVEVTVVAQQVRTSEGGDFSGEATVTAAAGDGSTGPDLDLGFSESATFTVTSGGQNVPADQIKLGGGAGVAEQNPVQFTKA